MVKAAKTTAARSEAITKLETTRRRLETVKAAKTTARDQRDGDGGEDNSNKTEAMAKAAKTTATGPETTTKLETTTMATQREPQVTRHEALESPLAPSDDKVPPKVHFPARG